MNLSIDVCPLSGYPLSETELKPVLGQTIEYETEYVGRVKMTLIAYSELKEGAYERFVIGGICKDRTLKGQEPVLIDSEFIRGGYAKLTPPIEFEEKCFRLNKVLYELYGKENKEFELRADRQFALAYADPEEFIRIVDKLESDHLIKFRKKHPMSRRVGNVLYMGVRMTNSGIKEAKKGLPKMPMFGLVSQEITTGHSVLDQKINQSRTLFFSEPQTLDNMRSACETLSHILEPLREDLKSYFSSSDVSDFFQLVNRFDIRHNKDSTINLKEAEQLEWVYYTLLNTLNTYVKLKAKGK